MKRTCEDCRGVGFLLMHSDTHGLRIERCDACRRYRTDDEAATAAFKAALKVKVGGWRRIADKRVRHRWELVCECTQVEQAVYVDPSFYAESGTPVCEECGEDRRYARTEVRWQ
jgi:hypothetical protein